MVLPAVPVDGLGICGSLHAAEPLDACSVLRTNWTAVGDGGGGDARFVLISRGVCSFEEKVRNAQDGGFEAAIIYDDQEKSSLYSSECTIRLFPTLSCSCSCDCFSSENGRPPRDYNYLSSICLSGF